MKWIQLPLFSLLFILILGIRTSIQFSFTDNPVESTWLIHFEEDYFRENIEWPSQIKQLEIHRPLHSIIIRCSFSESELRNALAGVAGITRLEKGYVDSFNSPVYPTGLALVEPRGEESIVFLK
jgi:hypothetical protein